MGTSCAPAYANLYLGGWERHIHAHDQYSEFLNDILLWYRFIDDLLLVWTGPRDKLLQFLHKLDTNDLNLKFTFKIDTKQISFLDLNIIKQPDGTLGTDLYRKPTAGNTLLFATSAHPTPLVRSIPYAQYLRLRRNCSQESDFKLQAKALRERLLLRGYSSTNLRRAYNKAMSRSRTSLLFKRGEPSPLKDTVRFITTYSAHHNLLRNILTKNCHLLAEHHTLAKYIRSTPEVVFRRARSLRDQLTSSHYTPTRPPKTGPNGTFKCEDCPRCPWVHEGRHFVLPNGETFASRTLANCGTKGVIYLMNCTCQAFYEGKTIRELRQRIGDHLYDSENGKLTTIGRHIGLYHRFDNSVVKFLVLEVVQPNPRGGDWDRSILQREALWIERLNATTPPGLNESVSYKAFL